MRLRKQSMREVADAGMVQRTETTRDVYGDIIAADIESCRPRPDTRPLEKRVYVRGALVKPRHSDNRK